VVKCLEQDTDLHIAQLMPLPLTFCCFSKIQIGFTFLVPAHLGSPGQMAVKQVCVCVRVCSVFILGGSWGTHTHTHTHTRLTALFQDYPGELVSER